MNNEEINIYDTSAYAYDLPEELIAQKPVYPRDSSRLLYYDRLTDTAEHHVFRDIVDLLEPGDVMVVNDTRVIPARLFGYDAKGREYEVLLLKRLDSTHWETLLRPARKAKIGSQIVINEELKLTIDSINPADGVRTVSFEYKGVWEEILDRVGIVPLTP